jgi:ribose-phosphate pyrophosphokinase
MIVVPGPASKELGIKIGTLLGARVVHVEFKHFPDGESYVRYIDDINWEDVVIVQTTSPPQDTRLVQLLLLIDAAKDLGARSVTAIVPYFAYSRQDKRFRPGEAISLRTMIKLIEAAGADRFVTVDVHNPDALRYFKIPTANLSAMSLLAEYAKECGLEGAFSLAPDEHALPRAKIVESVLNGGCDWLPKERDSITGKITVVEKTFDVQGKDAVVVDDIISTGGTMIAATSILKKQNARRVAVMCAHALLMGGAKEKIIEAGADMVVGTDSVSSDVTTVSVAPIVADYLRKGF